MCIVYLDAKKYSGNHLVILDELHYLHNDYNDPLMPSCTGNFQTVLR